MPVFEVVARKYSKEVLTSLQGGERGFREMMRILASKKPPTISTRTLSERLKEMEKVGLVRRKIVEGRPPKSVYSISEKGKKVLSLIGEMEEL
jgi:DNA-binding HxlR family transcriptional regulator